MNWLADNARFTLLYKHLSSRNRATPVSIPEHWQQPLVEELQTAHKASWHRCSGRQKLLRIVSDKASAGQLGLQPKHWFQACSRIRHSPTRFGQVIMATLLLLIATLVHTEYLLLEFHHQFSDAGFLMPLLSEWLLSHGKVIALGLTLLVASLSIWLKFQHRAIRLRIEQLNLNGRWFVPNVLNHCNIAVCGFWLSKLNLDELKDYLPEAELKRAEKLIQRHELNFMSQDPDCAELVWQQHIQAAIKASQNWQKRLTYFAYILLTGWFGILMFGAVQAFVAWGKLGS